MKQDAFNQNPVAMSKPYNPTPILVLPNRRKVSSITVDTQSVIRDSREPRSTSKSPQQT